MNNSEEKQKKTRQRKPKEETITAFEAKKQEIKKVLKKKPQPLADDEEPIQFDLPKPHTITNESSGLLVNSQTLKLPDAPFLNSIPTQQNQPAPKSEPIDIPAPKLFITPPTPKNSVNKYYQYIY